MGILKKTGLAAFGLLVLLGLSGGLWLATSFPKKTGQLVIEGLSSPVEIYRDEAGVPYIYAKTDADAYQALGFVHAQDRFWQMELMRRFGAGRLSEILGQPTLETDKWMQTLGLYERAREQVAELPAEVQFSLNAYANGVNQWIRTKSGLGAVEFAAFRYHPEPWQPADSLIWSKIMATRLSGNFRKEISRSRVASALGTARMNEFWPDYPTQAPTTSAHVPPASVLQLLAQLDAIVPSPAGAPTGASNQWVVNSDLSATNAPLLANDPHLGFGAPILWYLAYLETPNLKLTGATVPGVPFHILGHNAHIAWGITSTQADQEDLFIERISEHEDNQYVTPDGPKPFKRREVSLSIKDAPPQILSIRETRHGPVISDLMKNLIDEETAETVVALSAMYLKSNDRTFNALYQLNRATNWHEFRQALHDVKSPVLNLTYADTDGNIGFQVAGAVPERASGDGSLPSQGWSGRDGWLGTVAFSSLPSQLNQPSGRFSNANNPVGNPAQKPFITKDWEAPYRAMRIETRLASQDRFQLSDMQALQLDNTSLAAVTLLPVMIRLTSPVGDRATEALRLLQSWDGVMDRNRAEPLLYSHWLRALNQQIYFDELGELGPRLLGLRPLFIEQVLTQNQRWCDDTQTDAIENCEEMLSRSLSNAMDVLTERFGADMQNWNWGSAHQALFAHSVFKHVPLLNQLTDLRIENDGGNYTVNRGASRVTNGKAPFQHTFGAGYRAVYDLADLTRSTYQIATGQSGNFMSRHYRDRMRDWRDGKYLQIIGEKTGVVKKSDRPLVLVPPKKLLR